MPDFTSSLYLGLRHPAASLPPWDSLTTGVPAVLREPRAATTLAQSLAALQGLDRAVLARSTLHVFTDLFTTLARPGSGVLVDSGAYAVGRLAVTGAAAQGIPVIETAHHDPVDLAARLSGPPWTRLRPMLLIDGWCTGCGRAAPLAALRTVLRRRNGVLVVDDSQALGVLGSPAPGHLLGRGGGGSLVRAGVVGSDVIAVSSLAKAFGAPLAVVAGAETVLGRVQATGPTRMHASPPSQADLYAAQRALAVNAACGDRLRRRLADRIEDLRSLLQAGGVPVVGGLFPVQTVPGLTRRAAFDLHHALLSARIRSVVTRPRCGPGLGVTLIVTVAHSRTEIHAAAQVIVRARRALRPRSRPPITVLTLGNRSRA